MKIGILGSGDVGRRLAVNKVANITLESYTSIFS